MQRGTAGEHVGVAGLVGHLGRQEVLHLGEVRVHLAEEARRDDERGLLVLDEVGHHRHDGLLDGVLVVAWRVPRDDRGGVPLAGERVVLEAGRLSSAQRSSL